MFYGEILSAFLLGIVVAAYIVLKSGICKIRLLKNDNIRKGKINKLLLMWIETMNHKNSLAEYFQSRNYNRIVVYGMGNIGEMLVKWLWNNHINVVYAIDRSVNAASVDIVIKKPTDDLEPCDVIIVTAINDYLDIVIDLKKKINCPIVSLEAIISEYLGENDG